MAETPWRLIPTLMVSSGRAAIAFYKAAFGAGERFCQTTPDGAKVVHAELDINGSPLYLSDEFTPTARSCRVTLHLDVPDADAAFERAVKAGAKVDMPLADMFWGARYGRIEDPFGITWSLSTQKRQPTAEELREGVEKWLKT